MFSTFVRTLCTVAVNIFQRRFSNVMVIKLKRTISSLPPRRRLHYKNKTPRGTDEAKSSSKQFVNSEFYPNLNSWLYSRHHAMKNTSKYVY